MLSDGTLTNKLQSAQLIILCELDRVCKLLGVEYELAFGSSLGAKRHKGFIPWDDDIDVYMMVSDLEKLQRNRDLFVEPFFLQYSESDPEYGMMITRLRNSSTTLIEKDQENRDMNHGIYVDIYPLFECPQKGIRLKKLIIYSMIYRLMLYNRVPKNRGLVMKIGSGILLKLIPDNSKAKLIKWCYCRMKKYHNTGWFSSLYGDEANISYPKECFFPHRIVPFEDMEVPVQANQDKYLEMTFGDYMTLPPIDKRKPHHEFVYVDFDKPYSYYKGKYYMNK